MRKRKLLSLLLAGAIVLQAGTPVMAAKPEEQNEQLTQTVLNITSMMDSVLEDEKGRLREDLEEIIDEKSLDYSLTMESFEQNRDVFADYDYLSLYAAICAAKQSGSEKTISEISLASLKIKEASLVESTPKAVDRYVERNGFYVKRGVEYITEPTNIPVYREIEDGLYVQDGTVFINPDQRTVSYGEITVTILDYKDILKQYGTPDAEELYAKLLKDLNNQCSYDSEQISKTVQIKLPQEAEELLTKEAKQQIEKALTQAGKNTLLIQTAVSLIGKVPYEWGGKSEKAGIDETWFTYRPNGNQKGLDCSGYVQWCFRTAGYEDSVWQKIGSTAAILVETEPITKEQLKIGDLGLLNDGKHGTNHVGIYLGNGYFIHCASGVGTVVVNQFDFRLFRRVNAECPKAESELTADELTDSGTVEEEEKQKDSEDYVLAQMLSAYLPGDGLNAWIGACEVIKNQKEDARYPGNIKSVLSGAGFDMNKIKDAVPTQYQIRVASLVMQGRLAYVNNKRVLYYNNDRIQMTSKTNAAGKYMTEGKTTFYFLP